MDEAEIVRLEGYELAPAVAPGDHVGAVLTDVRGNAMRASARCSYIGGLHNDRKQGEITKQILRQVQDLGAQRRREPGRCSRIIRGMGAVCMRVSN